ncbi:MAG: DNA polymerase III subunit [Planctomycetota bacterium]|jgi:DNA polymerase-3 subunit delta'
MSLNDIFCQDKALSILQSAYAADRLGHAYIFAGADGVGRFRTARQWAKLLLCLQPVTGENFTDSCGQCQSCQKFQAGAHPDFNHVYKELSEFTKDGKKKVAPINLPIDVIREFLIEKVPTRPSLSQRKVFVVSEAEKLNPASQNALLKVLEEPPAYFTIILLCSRLEKLLATTKSRCQVVRFGPIEQDKIIEQLDQMGLGGQAGKYFAYLADGSLGQACTWAQLELNGADLYKSKKEIVDSLAKFQLPDAVSFAEQLLAKSKKIAEVWAKLTEKTSTKDINRRAHKTIIRIIIAAVSDAMKASAEAHTTLINFDQAQAITKLANRMGPETAAEKIIDAYENLSWIDASVNEKLIFEHLLLNLADSGRM